MCLWAVYPIVVLTNWLFSCVRLMNWPCLLPNRLFPTKETWPWLTSDGQQSLCFKYSAVFLWSFFHVVWWKTDAVSVCDRQAAYAMCEFPAVMKSTDATIWGENWQLMYVLWSPQILVSVVKIKLQQSSLWLYHLLQAICHSSVQFSSGKEMVATNGGEVNAGFCSEISKGKVKE